MTSDRLGYLPLADVAIRIARREISPIDVTEACLEVAARVEPSVHAFAELDVDGAMVQAREFTEELAAGPPRSPLHGVPIAIKDLMNVAGLRTRAGSAVLEDSAPASADAPLVSRLRAAGAVVLGKTHTHEFALGVITPSTRNPHDPERSPGGSSGGSAAAVAAFESFGAIGTDTGGSVRIPAALCGVVGIKPRRQTLSLEGTVPLSPLLDAAGVLTRTVADGRLLLEVLSGPMEQLRGNLHIGVVNTDRLGVVAPEVVDAVERAVRILRERDDVSVRPADPPPFGNWFPDRVVPLLADALEVHRAAGWYPTLRERYGADLRHALDRAAEFTAADITGAIHRLQSLIAELMACLDDHDALLLPTTPIVAPRIADALDPSDGRTRSEVGQALLRLCGPVNWCDAAAVSVPCGRSSKGLPIGIQLMARNEATALEAAARLEEALAIGSASAVPSQRPTATDPRT